MSNPDPYLAVEEANREATAFLRWLKRLPLIIAFVGALGLGIGYARSVTWWLVQPAHAQDVAAKVEAAAKAQRAVTDAEQDERIEAAVVVARKAAEIAEDNRDTLYEMREMQRISFCQQVLRGTWLGQGKCLLKRKGGVREVANLATRETTRAKGTIPEPASLLPRPPGAGGD